MAQFLYSSIARLSKTTKLIQNAVDTNNSYQIKKVKWDVQELIKEGGEVI